MSRVKSKWGLGWKYAAVCMMLLSPLILGAYIVCTGHDLEPSFHIHIVDVDGNVVDDVSVHIEPPPTSFLLAPPDEQGERFCNMVYDRSYAKSIKLEDICLVVSGPEIMENRTYLYRGDGKWKNPVTVVVHKIRLP